MYYTEQYEHYGGIMSDTNSELERRSNETINANYGRRRTDNRPFWLERDFVLVAFTIIAFFALKSYDKIEGYANAQDVNTSKIQQLDQSVKYAVEALRKDIDMVSRAIADFTAKPRYTSIDAERDQKRLEGLINKNAEAIEDITTEMGSRGKWMDGVQQYESESKFKIMQMEKDIERLNQQVIYKGIDGQ